MAVGFRERAARGLLLGSEAVCNSGSTRDNHVATGLLSARITLFVATLLLTACGLLSGSSQDSNLGHQTRLEPNSVAVLTCSQACADHGWCGTTSDQRPVVLGNALNPAMAVHDRLYLQDTQVNIDFISLATIEFYASGEQAELPFYHVTSFDEGKSAWIAGWCVATR